jgi:hypothetical protein
MDQVLELGLVDWRLAQVPVGLRHDRADHLRGTALSSKQSTQVGEVEVDDRAEIVHEPYSFVPFLFSGLHQVAPFNRCAAIASSMALDGSVR